MKKFLSFLVVVSFVIFMANVAKASDIIGTWAFDQAFDLYDNSGSLLETGYLSGPPGNFFEQGGEVRGAMFWFEHDPATSKYSATRSTTLNDDMLSYSYMEDYDIWLELEYTNFYLIVTGDKLIGEVNAIYTGNYGLAGWRHDPSEPLQWDDMTGYMDFVPWGYSADTDGMSVHVIMSGSRIPIPSAILLLGSGLIGLVGFRRKFRKP